MLFLGDNMQQKHLHATSKFDVDWRRFSFKSIIDCSLLGHGYNWKSSISRDAAIINHQGTRVHPRLLGVFTAEL
jgi:hypothetical protein